jgi:hypothetical protein
MRWAWAGVFVGTSMGGLITVELHAHPAWWRAR